jgi:hypothetical protein
MLYPQVYRDYRLWHFVLSLKEAQIGRGSEREVRALLGLPKKLLCEVFIPSFIFPKEI